jgi:hypothetical protein
MSVSFLQRIVMSAFPGFLDVFRRQRQTRVSKRRQSRDRLHLGSERLEPRALLAITAVGGGPVSSYLIVASSPDSPGEAASDVVIQRRAGGELLIADNSSFLPNANFITAGTPDTLYVTNGATGVGPGLMYEGDNTDGNYRLDAQLDQTTGFTLGSADIDNPRLGFGPNGEVIVINPILGQVRFDGATWDFNVTTAGTVAFSRRAGGNAFPVASPEFMVMSLGDNDERGRLTVSWDAPVATVPHLGPATTPQPPVLERVTYFASGSRSEVNILPSTTPTSYSFTIPNSVYGAGTLRGVIGGSVRGSVTVDGVVVGFADDIVGGTTLYFNGQAAFAVNQFVTISGSYAVAGDVIIVTLQHTSAPRGPTAVNAISYVAYVEASRPNSFTLFAGHDLPSQVRTDLLAAGSTINIDSPVIVATPGDPDSNVTDIELRATNINLNASVSSKDNLFIGPSAISGTPAELVRLNAAIAVPGQADIKVANDPTNDLLEGAPLKGELIISQSGRIAGDFALRDPFGDGSVLPISNETEPNNDIAESQNLMGGFTRIGDEIYRTTLTGRISPASDADYYGLTLGPGDTVVVDMDGAPTSVGTLIDPFLELRDATGAVVAADDDSGFGWNARLRYPVPMNATGPAAFHIVARRNSSGGETYRLTVTVTRTPATPTAVLQVDADTSDVYVEGGVFADKQSWLLRSTKADSVTTDGDARGPYTFTTRSKNTSGRTGVLQGRVVAVTLGNDADTPLDDSIAFSVVDLDTQVDSLRIKASTRAGVPTALNPFPYALTIREADALFIDAVAASSLPISLAAGGDIRMRSSLETAGGIAITTQLADDTFGNFRSVAALTTLRGTIAIAAQDIRVDNALSVTNPPQDVRTTDITLAAANGSIELNGLVSTPNNVSLRQQTADGKRGRIQGTGLVRARNLDIVADAVGNPLVGPADALYVLQTQVDSVTGEVKNGFAIRERDDLTVSQLRVSDGTVVLVADGTDGRAGSPNPIALTANGIDVSNLIVSTPNGSLDVRIDTGTDLVLGEAVGLRDGRSLSMLAAGDARIRSSAGPIRVLDAPFAGSGAREVRRVADRPLIGTYSPRTAGLVASEIQVSDAEWSSVFGTATGFQINDRVLVAGGVHPSSSAPANLQANGVYSVTTLGSSARSWVLRRAADSDTLAELPSGTIVKVTEGNVYRRLTHSMATPTVFGTAPITAAAASFTTNIGSNLPLPGDGSVVEFVVSSRAGTNTAAGSLGKMIALRQENDTRGGPNPNQPMSFSFSSLLGGEIQLSEELPTIVAPKVGAPLTIDGMRRYTPVVPGGTVVAPADITVVGTSINRTNDGVSKAIQTSTARPLASGELPALPPAQRQRTLVVSDSALQGISAGMAVSSVGVRAGARVESVNLSALASGQGTVTITEALEAAWTTGSRSVTFTTEINGFDFGADATGGGLANIAVGGFGSGAAVVSRARAAAGGVPGVTIRNVRAGQSWPVGQFGAAQVKTDGTPNEGSRLGNQFGVLVGGEGSALISGGLFTSSSGAGIRTQDKAGNVVIDGVTVGSVALFNVVGVELGGTGEARLGRSEADGVRNVVSGNRTGVVLRNGTNRISRTTIAQNSFEGVRIEGGEYQIGATRARNDASNEIVGNNTWALNIASGVVPGNPQTENPLRQIQGNFLGIRRDGQVSVNLAGNVAVDDVAATARVGLRPRASGIDNHDNLHAARPAGPTMYLAGPLDNDGSDQRDDVDNEVRLRGESARLTRFVFGIEDDNDAVNHATVTASAFTVRYSPSLNVTNWNGPDVTTWGVGSNYTFNYDPATRQASIQVASPLRPLPAGSYRVEVANSAGTGIRDASGNRLLANDVAGPGTTAFIVVLETTSDATDPDVYVIEGNGTDLVVDAPITRPAQSILIRNSGNIRINSLIEASQSGRRITVRSTAGWVQFGPAGELRATDVVLEARDSSQLRVGTNTDVASAVVSGGSLTLMGRGAIRQTGAITAQSLVVSEVGGAVTLDNAANAVNAFAVTAGRSGAPVTFVNSRGFTVASGTVVTAGTAAVADGGISLQALAGDLVVDGRLAAPADIAFLRAAGRVILGGTFTKDVQILVIQDSLSTRLDGSFLVADAAGLASAAAFINALPVGTAPCPVIVTASLTLDQTLTFNRPVILSAQSPNLQIRGSATVTNGLIFSAGAASSRITGLSFAQFAGTALSFDGVRNLQIQGITVVGGGTGLRLSGDMTGATVTGSRFQSVQFGMLLDNARNATIGGTAAALRNRIEGAARAGVVATGFCTGTRIVGMTFATRPATRVQFQVGSSRGLRITGTVTAR